MVILAFGWTQQMVKFVSVLLSSLLLPFVLLTYNLFFVLIDSFNASVSQGFLAATKQLYEWYFLSVCPSVRLSVRLSVCPSVRLSVCPSVTPFWLCSHHRIIMKFSGVITLDQGKVHAKGQGQRSKVKVTEVTTQIFRTVTPVWIHIWW